MAGIVRARGHYHWMGGHGINAIAGGRKVAAHMESARLGASLRRRWLPAVQAAGRHRRHGRVRQHHAWANCADSRHCCGKHRDDHRDRHGIGDVDLPALCAESKRADVYQSLRRLQRRRRRHLREWRPCLLASAHSFFACSAYAPADLSRAAAGRSCSLRGLVRGCRSTCIRSATTLRSRVRLWRSAAGLAAYPDRARRPCA